MKVLNSQNPKKQNYKMTTCFLLKLNSIFQSSSFKPQQPPSIFLFAFSLAPPISLTFSFFILALPFSGGHCHHHHDNVVIFCFLYARLCFSLSPALYLAWHSYLSSSFSLIFPFSIFHVPCHIDVDGVSTCIFLFPTNVWWPVTGIREHGIWFCFTRFWGLTSSHKLVYNIIL